MTYDYKAYAEALEKAHITCNKNAIPYDPQPPKVTSGIRLGSPAATTRGFKDKEFEQIGLWIIEVLNAINTPQEEQVIEKVKNEVIALCHKFPIIG
jgi:glycine hydroxymethyltransferase